MKTTGHSPFEQTIFFTLIRSANGERCARLLLESLRAFGGELSQCAAWIFLRDPGSVTHSFLDIPNIELMPLRIDKDFPRYFFADKVCACAQAEELAGPEVRSIIWFAPQCLIVHPPSLFDLSPSFDVAFRPVHIRNVGSLSDEPLDPFWNAIYQALGVRDLPFSIDSYADQKRLRPYFNTHCFSTRPEKGIAKTWWETFKRLAADQAFQAGPCQDEEHQIFLHQAILSVLAAKLLDWERIRILPPDYNYPLNLHQQVPGSIRPSSLGQLTNVVYEQEKPNFGLFDGLVVDEPWKSWLTSHLANE
jgi:hypothetical protein